MVSCCDKAVVYDRLGKVLGKENACICFFVKGRVQPEEGQFDH